MSQAQGLDVKNGVFPLSIAGPDFKFREVHLNDPMPTGRQIVDVSGNSPVEECVVLHWLPEGDVVEFGLNQTIDLRVHKTPRFIIAKADRVFLFEIDDKQGAWPEPSVARDVLLAIANQDPAKFSVWQEFRKEPDMEIVDGHPANLAAQGTERFYTVMSKTTEGEH